MRKKSAYDTICEQTFYSSSRVSFVNAIYFAYFDIFFSDFYTYLLYSIDLQMFFSQI